MRTFIVLTLAAASSLPAQTSHPAAQARELLPDEQVQQVLNRLTFGSRSGDAEKVRAMGIDSWIDQQLHPERIPDAGVDSLLSRYGVYSMPTSDIIHEYGVAQQLQRQVKREAGADTGMERRDLRKDALAQNPA